MGTNCVYTTRWAIRPRSTRNIWPRVKATWPVRPSISSTAALTTAIFWVEQMANWFRDNRPDIDIEVRRKSGVYTERDEGLYTEIQQQGAGAVMAVGH